MQKLHPKKKLYEELMARTTRAITSAHYLQASWYAYTILEDRMVAVLQRSGGATYANKKPIKMLGPKLDLIRLRRKNDALLAAYFSKELLDAVEKWKDERNDLMHAMADASLPLAQIDKRAYLLATQGQALVKTVCRHARQLRNNRHQIPIPAANMV